MSILKIKGPEGDKNNRGPEELEPKDFIPELREFLRAMLITFILSFGAGDMLNKPDDILDEARYALTLNNLKESFQKNIEAQITTLSSIINKGPITQAPDHIALHNKVTELKNELEQLLFDLNTLNSGSPQNDVNSVVARVDKINRELNEIIEQYFTAYKNQASPPKINSNAKNRGI